MISNAVPSPFCRSHCIIRASTKSFANFLSGDLTLNARLKSSDSNSMSWKLSASASRVKRFSCSIVSGEHAASIGAITQSKR